MYKTVLTSTTNSDMTPDGGGHLNYADSKWPMVSQENFFFSSGIHLA